MNESNVSEADFQYAEQVWNYFSIEFLGEYSDLWSKTDVMLLADVFEVNIKVVIIIYGVDPHHYYTFTGDLFLIYIFKLK